MKKSKQSIKSKITGAIVTVSTVVIFLVSITFLAYQIFNYRQSALERFAVLGNVMANASTAALTFQSREEAYEILSALKAEDYLVVAALYDADGNLFATYPAEVSNAVLPEDPGQKTYEFFDRYLEGYEPVMLGGKQIGMLYLRIDLRDVGRQLEFYLIITCCILVIAVLLAYFLSARLQKNISKSIISLSNTAQSVALYDDYSVRAEKHSEDEVGLLTDAFNQMLERVERQSSLLAESEKKFRTLADNIANICWMAGSDGKVFWYNLRWYEYTGLEPGTLDDPMSNLRIQPEQQPMIRQAWQKSLRDKTMFEMVLDLRHKDGNYHQHLSRVIPLKDQDGNVSQWFGTNTDISELRKVENALRLSEQFNRTIVDSSPDCIQVFDLEGNLLSMNYSGRKSLESRGGEFVRGRHWTSTWNEEFHEQLTAAATKALNGTPGHAQAVSHSANEKITWWDILVAPVFGPDGKTPERLVAVARDITKIKELEQQKDDFIGIASHELKTPITSIKAYVQLLQGQMQEKGDLQSAGMLRKVDNQLNRLTILITDLLDVTRIDQGRLKFREEYVDLNAIVKEVIADIQPTSHEHKIICNFEAKGLIYGDPDRLGQVVINLVTNAIKYSPKADTVIVKTYLQDAEVVLSVQDFGLGLTEKDRLLVFERFFRVEHSSHETYSGMGLGLYIVSEIVKRHGGKLWVESESGKGSVFYCSLPLAKKEQ